MTASPCFHRWLAVLAFSAGALLTPKASPGQDLVEAQVVKRKTVAIQLPKLKAPVKPLDRDVRVALFLPAPQNAQVYLVDLTPAAELTERRWYAGDRVEEVDQGPLTADEFSISPAEAASERLREIVQSLFPHTTIYGEGDVPGSEEIQIRAGALPKIAESKDSVHDVLGIDLRISLVFTDSQGHRVTAVGAVGKGSPKKSMYWSHNNMWEAMATEALEQSFDALIREIDANQPLKDFLDELAQNRALPSGMTMIARFTDDEALLPNNRLDAGDKGVLRVQVLNKGPGPAYDVAVRVLSDLPQVAISGNGTVGNLPAGESKEIALSVAGSLDLPSAIAKLQIETLEKRGYGARPLLFELPTAQLAPPHLEIVDITLNDQPSSSRSQGDGDGLPANGETLEAIVRVRNAGPGEAAGVLVTLSPARNAVELLEAKAIVPRIAANQVEEARLLFRLPLTLDAGDLPLLFQAVEARGLKVAAASKEQTWRVRTKRPAVELAYRLYDGGSTGSTGNRDGLVSNGERIELVVTPINRGDLPARNVKVTIESVDPRLSPRPSALEIGDLPAQAEGAAQRFSFDIPRDYGADQPEKDLRFSLNVAQQYFPLVREPVVLSFRSLRPELSLETVAPPPVARGGNGELVLRLRNTGALRAEDVVLEVTSEATGVDLLNERGVPVTARKVALGALDPQGKVTEQRFQVNVRRNAAVGVAPLRIAISQKDFRPVAQTAALPVTEEPVEVIAAAQPAGAAQERAPSSVAAAPATISFLRNTQGEHLIAEAIVLRFEVQSAVDLAEVRLTQNERLLSLEGARRTAGSASGVQAMQYEIPVQLEEGENRFEVVAVTRQGLRSARSLKLIRDHEVGRLWVVAIGVSQYQDPAIPGLRYADADARAVFDYFRDTFGLPESQVFLRINEQATLREVKSVLGTQLVARANDPRDTVVLYLAGHGMRDRVTGSLDADGLSKYFLPYDASRSDLYSTALDMEEVTNILRRLTPERVVVLLDSCFSGAAGGRSPFDPTAERERAMITGEFLDRMAHVGKGRVVITASGPEESAQESADFAHGVFTYYLLSGLRGAADLSGDGEIDVHEIYRYVSEQVGRATKGRQNPKLKEPDTVGRILLGRGAVRSRQ